MERDGMRKLCGIQRSTKMKVSSMRKGAHSIPIVNHCGMYLIDQTEQRNRVPPC